MLYTTTNEKLMTQSEFLNLVMPFKDKLYRLAKRLLVSTEEAEDATQEVLMKLWSKKKGIGSYRNVEAFAMTMTKNFCLDRLKSKQSGNLKLVHSNYADGRSSLQDQVEAQDGWRRSWRPCQSNRNWSCNLGILRNTVMRRYPKCST